MINYRKSSIDSKEVRKCIGERIKKERKRYDLTQTELSIQDNLRVSKATVINWEKGRIIPTIAQFIALSNIFGCDPSYLLCEYDAYTKEKSDIIKSTGIINETIDYLQELLVRKETSDFVTATKIQKNHKTELLFYERENLENDVCIYRLAFINYFILHSERCISIIMQKQKIHSKIAELNANKHKQYILACYNHLADMGFTSISLYETRYSQAMPDDLIPDNLPVFVNNNLSSEEITEIRDETRYFYDVLLGEDEKQLDYIISNMFLDMVKDFLQDSDNIINSYLDTLWEVNTGYID